MCVQKQIEAMAKSLQELSATPASNQTLTKKVSDLAQENAEMKRESKNKADTLNEKRNEWMDLYNTSGTNESPEGGADGM